MHFVFLCQSFSLSTNDMLQESLSEEMNEAWLQKETRLKESFEEQKLIDLSKQSKNIEYSILCSSAQRNCLYCNNFKITRGVAGLPFTWGNYSACCSSLIYEYLDLLSQPP